MVLASMPPTGLEAVLAYVARCRALFWGAMFGAVIGALLGPTETARYHDPLDQLLNHTLLGLEGSIPCSVGGMAIGWIIARGINRHKRSPLRQMESEEM